MSKKKGTAPAAGAEEDIIRAYMEQQNRPFSVQNLLDAHQKNGIKKAACERALAALVGKGDISLKEYGKSKVYIFRQDTIPLPSDEEMAEIDAGIAQKTVESKELAAKVAEEQRLVAELQSTMTLEQARQRRIALTESNKEADAKVQALGDITNLMSKEDKEKMTKTYKLVMDSWKKRKRYVKDVIGTLSEATGTKYQDLVAELGVETDEEAGVAIETLPAVPTASKKGRK